MVLVVVAVQFCMHSVLKIKISIVKKNVKKEKHSRSSKCICVSSPCPHPHHCCHYLLLSVIGSCSGGGSGSRFIPVI